MAWDLPGHDVITELCQEDLQIYAMICVQQHHVPTKSVTVPGEVQSHYEANARSRKLRPCSQGEALALDSVNSADGWNFTASNGSTMLFQSAL
jgi:hypothetical protein